MGVFEDSDHEDNGSSIMQELLQRALECKLLSVLQEGFEAQRIIVSCHRLQRPITDFM